MSAYEEVFETLEALAYDKKSDLKFDIGTATASFDELVSKVHKEEKMEEHTLEQVEGMLTVFRIFRPLINLAQSNSKSNEILEDKLNFTTSQINS